MQVAGVCIELEHLLGHCCAHLQVHKGSEALVLLRFDSSLVKVTRRRVRWLD